MSESMASQLHGEPGGQPQINHPANRSPGLRRTAGALPLRSLCATAGSQRVIRRAERCNPNKEEKRKKNEQPEELEAFTINYLQLLLLIYIYIYL